MKTTILILQTELTKIKNTAIPWVLFLAPIVYASLIYMLFRKGGQAFVNEKDEIWEVLNSRYWMPLLMMLVPIFSAIIISVSHYLDSKNHMWKVFYTLPINKAGMFISKSLFNLLLIFLLYLLSGFMVIPLAHLINFTTDLPVLLNVFPTFYDFVFPLIFKSFVATLALWAIHNWISYRFDNFIVSVSVALIGTVISMVAIQGWQDIIYYPYAFPVLSMQNNFENANILLYSVISASVIFILSVVDAIVFNKTKA